MDEERILIVEPESRIAELAVLKLSNAGYLVSNAVNIEDALKKLNANPPDIIIANPNLPASSGDGYEFCNEVRHNPKWMKIPLVLLVDQEFNEEQFKQWGVKVDDFLIKPFSPKALLNKVNSLMVKIRLTKALNPLTELPGKVHLVEALNSRLADGNKLALIFADLKKFAMYNQNYGFDKGDEVIRFLAGVLHDQIEQSGTNADLYHLGGDDFCILMDNGDPAGLCEAIIHRFDEEIAGFYPEGDRNRGGMVMANRQGIIEQWPILTIGLGIVSNERRTLSGWLQAEAIGAELLKYCKTMPGSQYSRDRRGA
ncbi:MAG TPA: diguanylate cyclase [Bacillota bacterium]